jgi:hypothetical protein
MRIVANWQISAAVVYGMHLQGVIRSNPDAWVWLGDITYMDDPLLDCSQVPSFPECNCSADFMRRPPFQ